MDQVFGFEYSSRIYQSKDINALSNALLNYALYGKNSSYIDRLSLEEVYFLGIGDLIPEIAKATEYALDVHYVGSKSADEAAELFKQVLPMKEGMKEQIAHCTRPR